MSKITWNASSSDGILSPAENKIKDNQSEPTDARFGGHREHSNVASAKDYTARSSEDPQKEENPVDDAVRDVDDMSNTEIKKNEFTYQENKMDVQKGNEGTATQSDSDRRPRMDEGSDVVQTPDVIEERVRKKANKWQYDSSNTYEGETS